MKVSVVIVTYNRERFMPAIYDCYARQTHPDTELLVLDDSDAPSPLLPSWTTRACTTRIRQSA